MTITTTSSLADGSTFQTVRLLHIWAAAAWLDTGTTKILTLIEEGALLWAFDIGNSRRKREIRILAESVADYMAGKVPPANESEQAEWQRISDIIIPAKRQTVTTLELALAWSCDVNHIRSLIHGKQLPVLNFASIRPGPGGSAVIARRVALAWLLRRRVI